MRSLRLAAAAAALTLALAACGSSSSSATSNSAPAGGGASSSVSGQTTSSGGGKKVDVTLKDFSITVAGGKKLAPGSYTFVVTNEGPTSHNLTINGPGVSKQATPTFASGTQTLNVTLQNGSYELYCSVPGHKQLGMDDTITVSSSGSVSTSSSTASSGGGSSSSGGSWS